MKSILIVSPQTDDARSRYLRAADELDVEACFLLPRETNLKFDPSLLKNRRVVHVARMENDSAALRSAVATLGPLDGIAAGGEFAVGPADHLSRGCGLRPSMDGDPQTLRNKAAMRRALAMQQVPQPRLIGVASTPQELRAILDRVERFPVITKPADMAGSWYVSLNPDAATAERHAAPIFADRVSLATGLGFSGECLVEEYIEGKEYSAELVVQEHSIVRMFITRKFLSPLPWFDEIGHLCGPALLPDDMRLKVAAAAAGVVAAARVANSVVHMEFRITANGPRVIEAGCRVAGDRISTLVEHAFGYNLEKAMICLKLGLDAARAQRAGVVPTCCGVRFLFAGQPAADVPGATVLESECQADRDPAPGFSPSHLVNRIGHELLSVDSVAAFCAGLADA